MALIEEVTKPDGARGLRYNFHFGQRQAWASTKRFPLVLAGTQSGKTAFGPCWLHREIQRCGPGDYLCVSPTYPLMNLKMLNEFQSLFRLRLKLGEYKASDRVFTYHDESVKVFFGHAGDSESLESGTIKAAWLDEAGQNKFRLASWEAIQRRLSINQGRALLTTTPYNLGWLKQRLFDPWEASGRNHPDIDVIGFESIANPAFPRAEYERARRELPGWKFDLFYRARFTRPAGMIYDVFETAKHTRPRFTIPSGWPRFLGLDFGGVNTAGLFFAEEPGSGKLYAYREYHAGGRTAAQHVVELLKGEPEIPVCAGGAGSEQQWRDEFAAAGLPVCEPDVSEVEVGINRVYGQIASGKLLVFDDLVGLLDELGSYSREVDDMGEPTEKIEDKSSYHRLDAVRYIVSSVVVEVESGGTRVIQT